MRVVRICGRWGDDAAKSELRSENDAKNSDKTDVRLTFSADSHQNGGVK